MNDSKRVDRLERLVKKLYALQFIVTCDLCGLVAKSIDDISMIEDTDNCINCNAEMEPINEVE